MVDIDNDGWLDIYVSVAGPDPNHRGNLLYVNQGNGSFKEKAKDYGVDDNGHSMQSAFFDYDRDGDLDLYVANYPPSGFGVNDNMFFAKRIAENVLSESDKLYRNENGIFVDVTQESGILNYGLSLGLSVSDFNKDGWPDIYVSNDFNSPDYLYINQGDGTFSNELSKRMQHVSNFGMGTDAADINNDGHVDLFQADMRATTNAASKANMSPMNAQKFEDMVNLGLYYQYMKNTLQLNNGNGGFSEIGELAGVASTDWSWSTLFLDMDNDGNKDIYVTNGMRRSVNNNDFNAFMKIQNHYNGIDPSQYMDLLQKIPVNPAENYAFLNNGDLRFNKMESKYGLGHIGFSNGAAYADFDLDGDLDLVVNNLDEIAHLYKNVCKW